MIFCAMFHLMNSRLFSIGKKIECFFFNSVLYFVGTILSAKSQQRAVCVALLWSSAWLKLGSNIEKSDLNVLCTIFNVLLCSM